MTNEREREAQKSLSVNSKRIMSKVQVAGGQQEEVHGVVKQVQVEHYKIPGLVLSTTSLVKEI